MDELKTLKFKRGQAKGMLTRLQNYLSVVDQSDINEAIITQLKLRLQKFEPIIDEFSQYQSDIEYILETAGVSVDEKEKEYLERDSFEGMYYDLVSKITALISKFDYGENERMSDNYTNKSPSETGNNTNNGQPFNGNLQAASSAKLPILKLPTFSGSFDKWLEFSDAFSSLVDKSVYLDKTQKFYYLRSSLEGEAAELIESIKITSDNYDLALSLLKERYENKRLIVSNYVKALFDTPVLTKESHTELRKLYDTFNKNIRSLEILGQPTDKWDALLIYLMSSKFDNQTSRDWEAFKIPGEMPTVQDIKLFLKEKCELLEKLECKKVDSFKTQARNIRMKSTHALVSNQNSKFSCYFCKADHSIFKCESFGKLNTKAKNDEIRKLKLCINCFSPYHNVQKCTKFPCRKCNKMHNTLLHRDMQEALSTQVKNNAIVGNTAAQVDNSLLCEGEVVATQSAVLDISANSSGIKNVYALLSTAMVNVKNKNGDIISVKMLLDPGSQSNFLTEDLCNKLELNKIPVNFAISGVGDNSSLPAKYKASVTINSRIGNFTKEVSCLILPRITQAMPSFSFKASSLDIPLGIQLADPKFNEKSEIDILCGVSLFYDLLLMNQIKLQGGLTLQNTKLGWILGGELTCALAGNVIKNLVSCVSIDDNDSINENLLKFWQIEETHCLLKKDNYCEDHFKKTCKRDSNGRFVVELPLKSNVSELGNSKEMALRRFELLENRLSKNDNLKQQYSEFMSEYERLGHMRELSDNIDALEDGTAYYIPHHAVIKNSSLTTKLRVVFDASAKTDNGLSLNDIHLAGPTVQSELFDILLRFREYSCVINADISKMYRQVLIQPDQRRFQRIFWRSDPTEKLKCYELTTVTYGVAASPFLATRCLVQLAIDNKQDYPLASKAIESSFYVDDLLTGSDSDAELLTLQIDITKILRGAGFELRKWLSNRQELCEKFQVNNDLEASILRLGENEQNKTLGVYWNAQADTLEYRIGNFDNQNVITKRSILSVISQIFDPMGLLGPVVINAKFILQMLWKENLKWDQLVSHHLREKWLAYCNDLKYLNHLKINRYVLTLKAELVELHAFADASEKGYGVCLYVRTKTSTGYVTKLLCAKSKVAPIKQLTLPRLELCAAVLAAKLTKRITNSLSTKFDKIYYWTDSTITWHWIKGTPDKWKTFVANRVSVIQALTEGSEWNCVKSEENPADIISRGSTVARLLHNDVWWEGPSFLKSDISNWNTVHKTIDTIPEQRVISNSAVLKNDLDIFSKYSSLSKLKRVTAYCKRFIVNTKNPNNHVCGSLSATEVHNAFQTLLMVSQIQSFAVDYNQLKTKRSVNKSSNILSLNPFLDSDNLIRVGGRLQNASMPDSKKHPIILHHKHPLTVLIMTDEHKRLLHCGPQQLLYSIRQSFWPISGRSLARQIVHKCVICFKAKPKSCDYLMGNLPVERVNQFLPFVNTGCDYAGPFLLKDRKTRNPKLMKSWICIFICMSTKVVHLELVTDLTSQAFIACFKRFIARRGKPTNVFSDNATTFVGAYSDLSNFFKDESNKIKTALANENISWRFIPPRAPNFGGLWEAGVKSIKHHLKRTIGNVHLHYEEFYTLLTQIEAILNSRPLSPLSSNPDDFSPLTPGHFLVGRCLTSLPEPSLVEIQVNRLNLYKMIQQLMQQFWRRWSLEYISDLQSRQKWNRNAGQFLKVNDLVLIKDDNLPPTQMEDRPCS